MYLTKIVCVFILTTATVNGIVYLGCYSNGALPKIGTSASNTPDKCASRCKEYRYAGVRLTECFCGKTMTAEKMWDSYCTYVCPGDNSKVCGGRWSRISVYTNWACGLPPTIANGNATFRNGTNITYGSIADVNCDPGFISKPTITCLSNTSWEKETCTQSGTSPAGTTHPIIHEENSIPDSSTTTHLDASTTIYLTSKVPSTQESTAVGIGIGVAVGLLCAVGAIVVIIVLRRRGALMCKYGTNTDTTDITKVGSLAVTNRSYEDTNDNHNYFILEERAQSVEDTVDHYNTADEPNTDNDETNNYNSIDEDPYHSVKDDNGEYDFTTNAVSTGPNSKKQDNVYNKLKMDRPGDYDHVGRLEHKVTIAGNDYNTTALSHTNDGTSNYNHISQPGSTAFAQGNGPKDLAHVDYDSING